MTKYFIHLTTIVMLMITEKYPSQLLFQMQKYRRICLFASKKKKKTQSVTRVAVAIFLSIFVIYKYCKLNQKNMHQLLNGFFSLTGNLNGNHQETFFLSK